MVGSLLGGTDINYVVHKGCVHKSSGDRWKQQEFAENVVLTRRKDLADGVGLNHLKRAT